jgi:predicted O-methyltransferase YrrM
MAQCKHFDFEDILALEYKPGLASKVATQHLKLYHLVTQMNKPVIVELGVARGRSTCVLVHACEAAGGHLYSIDIADCSDAATSSAWTFIQEDDLNIQTIQAAAPGIKEGIDLLHIDSQHRSKHVGELLTRWFPYVKANGYITMHDIDPNPYTAGQRKDSPGAEYEVSKIADTIRQFFYANEEELFLEFHFGSTGMGMMRKLSPLGTLPVSPGAEHSRRFWWLHLFAHRLARRIR